MTTGENEAAIQQSGDESPHSKGGDIQEPYRAFLPNEANFLDKSMVWTRNGSAGASPS